MILLLNLLNLFVLPSPYLEDYVTFLTSLHTPVFEAAEAVHNEKYISFGKFLSCYESGG